MSLQPYDVELVAAERPVDGATIRQLFQLYQYDFSEIEPAAIGSDGRFHQLDDAAWDHAYLITADAHVAGFAVVSRRASKLTGGQAVWCMQEFFVMRGFRRHGVGRAAAHAVIRRHPGPWEVTHTRHNIAANAFWRNVARDFGGGERAYDDRGWERRPLFVFPGGPE